MKPKTGLAIIKETFSDFMEDKALRLSAAMAYYAVFSIGPLLLLVVGVAGLVLGSERVHEEVSNQLKGLVGAKSAGMLDSMMEARQTGGSLIATIIGGVALLLGASGVFGQLQDALNTIWEVKPKPNTGIWGFLRNRFLSMGMVLVIGFLLLVSMVLTTALSAMSDSLSAYLSVPEWVAHALNLVVSFGVISLLFALIFKMLPDVRIAWKDVWIGAMVTALLFTAGKFVLGWYLGRESTESAFGAAAAFVIILLYVYYSSLILFLGAEFTQVYARRSGSRILPSQYAEPATEEQRAQEGMPPRESARRASPRPAKRHPARPRTGPEPVYGYANQTGEAEGESMAKKQSGASTLAYNVQNPPLRKLQEQKWAFLGMALTAGVAAGLLLKFRTLRKALKYYAMARRII